MLNKFRNLLMIYLTILSIGIGSFCPAVIAVGNEEEGAFSIQAVLPENQLNDQVDYFHLLAEPEMEQVLKIKIANYAKTKQTFLVTVCQASTNKNGRLVYNEREKAPDESLKVPITAIAKPKNIEVTVPGNGEKEAEIQLRLPEEGVKGLLLGGITVAKKDKEGQTEKGVALRNTLSYTLALLLTEKKDTAVYGETEIGSTQAQIISEEGKVKAQMIIRNPHPEIVKELAVEGRITAGNNQKVIGEKKLEQVKFAPNSTLLFEIELSEQELEGTYWFTGSASGNEKTWKLSEQVMVKGNEKKEVIGNKGGSYDWVYAAVGILLIGAPIVSYKKIRNVKKAGNAV